MLDLLQVLAVQEAVEVVVQPMIQQDLRDQLTQAVVVVAEEIMQHVKVVVLVALVLSSSKQSLAPMQTLRHSHHLELGQHLLALHRSNIL
jgi:hypothetical protein